MYDLFEGYSPDELELMRHNDSVARLAGLVQFVVRQGGGAWEATELMSVPTDDDGGGTQVGPGMALLPEQVQFVPEDLRRWVTVHGLERELAEHKEAIAALSTDTISADTVAQSRDVSEFAAGVFGDVRRWFAAQAPSRLTRRIGVASSGPKLRQSQVSRRSHRSNAPPAGSGDKDSDGEGDPPLPPDALRGDSRVERKQWWRWSR